MWLILGSTTPIDFGRLGVNDDLKTLVSLVALLGQFDLL
jgi:hypothetical protein